MKIPTQQNIAKVGQGETDPAIGRNADRKSRQILIDFIGEEITTLSLSAIKDKVKVLDAICQVNNPPPLDNVTIEGVTKLRNNGLVILFGTKEVVEWLQSSQAKLTFTASLAPGANIRQRQHIILVPKVPLTLDPTNEAHLREIEEINSLKENSIMKVRWIKPETRCKPDQQLAHTFFSLSCAKEANTCIRDRIVIYGLKSYPSKIKQELIQCLKCRRWEHYANQWTATKDTCGTCGGDYWTNTCSQLTKKYCVSCNAHSHSSWDRQCPEFIRRCKQFNESHPENMLKYYPTEEPWTTVTRPTKIPYTDRFPTHFVVESLSPRPFPQAKVSKRKIPPDRPANNTNVTPPCEQRIRQQSQAFMAQVAVR